MNTTLRLVAAQINTLVGAVEHNTNNIIAHCLHAKDKLQADLVIFPELCITGYPPDGLLLRNELHQQVDAALTEIANAAQDICIIVGHPTRFEDQTYNSLSVFYQQQCQLTYHKQLLPNFGLFDEKRYFAAGDQPGLFHLHGLTFGVLICEDLWQPEPIAALKQAGAQCVLSANASPFRYDKAQQRELILKQRTHETSLPILYTHGCGAQDEYIFDGGSLAIDEKGIAAKAQHFQEQHFLVEIDTQHSKHWIPGRQAATLCDQDTMYRALVLGLRDYLKKNHANGALVGLSGGIDSALTLSIAVDAVGAHNVQAVMLPSPYTSQISLEDAQTLAENLDVDYQVLSIAHLYRECLSELAPCFRGAAIDQTEENIQARLRMILLMALSNKSGKLLLNTSNKSELAVGYGTLYGDLSGAFAVLKDILKTQVYDLARWVNCRDGRLPERIITRAPSAELAPDQTDQQTLPPYDILDAIIIQYVEQDRSLRDIIASGIASANVIESVLRLIDRSEYKRRQAPPGVRISARAFGRDRRYPITSGFRSLS